MPESKRKKLHAKGWKIGTAKDFLGMSDEEESSNPANHELQVTPTLDDRNASLGPQRLHWIHRSRAPCGINACHKGAHRKHDGALNGQTE